MSPVGKDQRIKGNEKERQVDDAVPPEHIRDENEVYQRVIYPDNQPNQCGNPHERYIDPWVEEEQDGKINRSHHAESQARSGS